MTILTSIAVDGKSKQFLVNWGNKVIYEIIKTFINNIKRNKKLI